MDNPESARLEFELRLDWADGTTPEELRRQVESYLEQLQEIGSMRVESFGGGKTTSAGLLLREMLNERVRLRTDSWLVSIGFWIPRGNRQAIIGDLLEDCGEMRSHGFSEPQIRRRIRWQLLVVIVHQWPFVARMAVWAWIANFARRFI
jgi:hypothetical protein